MSTPSIHRLLHAGDMALSRPQHRITSPDPDYAFKKRRSKTLARDRIGPGEVFYYTDEFNIGWLPTLCAMGAPEASR